MFRELQSKPLYHRIKMRFSPILCALFTPLRALGLSQINLWVSSRIFFPFQGFPFDYWQIFSLRQLLRRQLSDLCRVCVSRPRRNRRRTFWLLEHVMGPGLWLLPHLQYVFPPNPSNRIANFFGDEGRLSWSRKVFATQSYPRTAHQKFCKNPECSAWDKSEE